MNNKGWCTLLAVLALVGCRANTDSVEQFISDAHLYAKADIEPLPEPYYFVADDFVMTNDRVPFSQPQPEEIDSKEAIGKDCWQPDDSRRRQPLESFPLDQLVMKGIMGGGKQRWALIYTPESKLAQLRVGQYIGLNHGRVLKITPQYIDIEEILSDGKGCWLKRDNQLRLKAEDIPVF
ncbi:pilus assembly protein PilQ [Photobacterium jeanii]|uniref:Pilus assembly protein PilQ n=1 Tax=Photobacterium jeanii TaxID=858640 RepID=A0A178KIJ6_9GAMM|nr:pilus assembly protein PilP [Photobacterium jeanii]OAN17060.1 pilus assembly protein PilQ [Photobacterium jeanii]PST88349.1 pilus assembly protein PilQ [Photobacterium jeanii]